jgi:lysophospholipase L1-like esterase
MVRVRWIGIVGIACLGVVLFVDTSVAQERRRLLRRNPTVAQASTSASSLVSTTPVARPDDWWTKRHNAIVERVKQGNVDLIFVGDSITHGWEGGGAKLWGECYGKLNAVNMGFSGDQTQHVLWRFDHGEIDKIAPKLAVVMIGTNNTGSRRPADETVAGIKAVVGKLRTKLPNTKVLLLAVFPRGEKTTDGLRVMNEAVNKQLPKLADGKNVFFLNFNDKLLEKDGTLSKKIMPDLLHPNAEGYKIWVDAVAPYVVKYVGQASESQPSAGDAKPAADQPKLSVALAPAARADAWWQDRHASMNKRVKQGNVDLVFIGDSITHGWEGAGAKVWNEYYSKRNAVNLGIGGDQTAHVLWRLDHGNIDGISPKLAVVMIGTNNTGHYKAAPEETAAGVKAIVEKLRAKLPETKILLLAIFPRDPKADGELRQINNKVNAIIAKLADGDKVSYMDLGDKMLDKDGTLTKEMMSDFLHPGDKGYRIWAEAIEPVVAKEVGPK